MAKRSTKKAPRASEDSGDPASSTNPANPDTPPNPEQERLDEDRAGTAPWRRWGCYVSQRQWGTVREDYSADGDAWNYFPHDHARSRAYRWGEDGIAGICDDRQRLCLTLALWNGQDPILKERLFGLANREGNHGEDPKELYWFLDAVPTMSWLRMLYKYPQRAFPYDQLVRENAARGLDDPEFELLDTGVFDDDRYFDVFVEYAKAGPEDLLMRIEIHNRGPDAAPLWVIPQLFFRNTWSWTRKAHHPRISLAGSSLVADHDELGEFVLAFEGDPTVALCENETNVERLYGQPRDGALFKDGIGDFVVSGRHDAVRLEGAGSKAGVIHRLEIPAGGSETLRLRLGKGRLAEPFAEFDATIATRKAEADRFCQPFTDRLGDEDKALVQRQALAGLIWSRQYYQFDVRRWLEGDPAQPPPPPQRRDGRNRHWGNFSVEEIVSMPDTWEYPWFAAWDLAFHCVAFAAADPDFAKRQVLCLMHNQSMHPSGAVPAYEWCFDDVNPPVTAWAAWRVYQIEQRRRGEGDRVFLKQAYLRMLLNFTWWVNRKDDGGNNIFEGGFLGLDNVGIFDRSQPLPTGGRLMQADATAWMAKYALTMMRISLELSLDEPLYQDLACKFFEHFLEIASAMTSCGGTEQGLWDEQDEFYYDWLQLPDGQRGPMRIPSIVGLTPLFAVEVLEPELVDRLPIFRDRVDWYFRNRPELADLVSRWPVAGKGERRLLSLLRGHRMKCLLRRALDPAQFLSDHGVRSMSRALRDAPFEMQVDGEVHSVRYWPAESAGSQFGGNSNWRGPIWMPVNYLLVESLLRFHEYYGDDFLVESPTGSGATMTLEQISDDLATRLCGLFLRNDSGRRPVFGECAKKQQDPHFRDLVLFHEYFDGDTGRGCGAEHQTGWTGLVLKLITPRHWRL